MHNGNERCVVACLPGRHTGRPLRVLPHRRIDRVDRKQRCNFAVCPPATRAGTQAGPNETTADS